MGTGHCQFFRVTEFFTAPQLFRCVVNDFIFNPGSFDFGGIPFGISFAHFEETSPKGSPIRVLRSL
jgi:hypothetical protein